MVNAGILGKTYPPTPPYLVGREKVREFSRAVMLDAPHHYDPEAARAAGYSDIVAPPTFAIILQSATLQQLKADEETGIDFARVVHGEQDFRYSRPIVAGDELSGVLTIIGVRQAGGNTLVTYSTDMSDASGAHVVTSTSTLVVRGAATDRA